MQLKGIAIVDLFEREREREREREIKMMGQILFSVMVGTRPI